MDMGGVTSSAAATVVMATQMSENSMPMSTGIISSSGAMDSSMSMGMGTGSCKISMLWNWDTIDACFISSTWHITSKSMFAGSCIGVVCLVGALECLRRVGREYDRFIVLSAQASITTRLDSNPDVADATVNRTHDRKTAFASVASGKDENAGSSPLSKRAQGLPVRPTLLQQLIRSVLHMLQFGVGYFIMLLAMYYNGYIIICILLGALIGSFIFSWDLPTGGMSGAGQQEVSGCCG